MKILLSIPSFTKEAKDMLMSLGTVVAVPPDRTTVLSALPECTMAVIGLGVVFDKELLSTAPHLRVIATATTGLDHIDLEYAAERGITVLSLRGEDAFLDTVTGTAELATGLMLALARRIPHAHHHVVEKGLWRREDFRGVSLYKKTLGIVGMGRLGRLLARVAEGFQMDVIFYDPHVEEGMSLHYRKTELSDLLKCADFVSIHVHLSEATAHLFSVDAFRAMKNTAYLINTARGGIVDEGALLDALKTGEIAGYGTDVLSGETLFMGDTVDNHPLVSFARECEQVIITPHIGGMTEESRRATDIFIAQKVTNYMSRRGVVSTSASQGSVI